MARRTELDDLAERLFDYAVAHPEGFTNRQAIAFLGLSGKSHFDRATRRLRMILGSSDSINLICDPQGMNESWLYKLVGTVEDARGWASNRIRDLEARLETTLDVSRSLVGGTDGRTVEGRKARKIARTLSRLIEDLAEIKEDGQLGLLNE